MNIKAEIGEKIRKARAVAKLSRLDLGNMVGCAEGTIRKWELGESSPDFHLLISLADHLQKSVLDFLPDEIRDAHSVEEPHELYKRIENLEKRVDDMSK